MFKTIRAYIKLRRDYVEITNLETGQTVSERAVIPFSTERNVVSSFDNASKTIKTALGEAGIKISLWATLHVLVQQQESAEDGLSDIEKRALRDLGEMTGARKVYLVEETRPLSVNEALTHFS